MVRCIPISPKHGIVHGERYFSGGSRILPAQTAMLATPRHQLPPPTPTALLAAVAPAVRRPRRRSRLATTSSAVNALPNVCSPKMMALPAPSPKQTSPKPQPSSRSCQRSGEYEFGDTRRKRDMSLAPPTPHIGSAPPAPDHADQRSALSRATDPDANGRAADHRSMNKYVVKARARTACPPPVSPKTLGTAERGWGDIDTTSHKHALNM